MDVSFQDQIGIKGHQCKTRNQKGNWTLKGLEKLGCISYLQKFLRQCSTHEYCLVSNQAPTELKKLADIARTLNQLEQFKESLRADKAMLQTWTQWCGVLNLHESLTDSELVAFDLLKRFHFMLIDDTGQGREIVLNIARELFSGDQHTACLLLIEFINDHIGQRIHQDNIKAFLDEKGILIKDCGFTPRLGRSIQLLKDEYVASIKPHLIESQLIDRVEADKLFQNLDSKSVTRIHCVHGRAGIGKSSVLFALTKKLEEAQIPYLPIRFDIRVPTNTSYQFGLDCGLTASPERALGYLAADRTSVLILDQLDALSWTPQSNSTAWVVFRRLVDDALIAFPNMHVVVACRTSDLRNDVDISQWRKSPGFNSLLAEYEVGVLSPDTVAEIIHRNKGDWGKLQPRERELLQQPILLSIWLNLLTGNSEQSTFRSASDLLLQFFEAQFRKLEKIGLATQASDALGKIVRWLDSKSQSVAPRTFLHEMPTALDALRSVGILDPSKDHVRFGHQSFLDFKIACLAKTELDSGADLAAWLKENDEQSLHRRSQFKYLLSLLRDEAPECFAEVIKPLLLDESVRFHLRHIILQALGNVEDPTQGEIDLVIELLANSQWSELIVAHVICSHPSWVEKLLERKLLSDWLLAEEVLVQRAIRICGSVCETRSDLVAQVIDDLPLLPEDQRHSLIKKLLPWNRENESARMFALRMELAREGKLDRIDFGISRTGTSDSVERVVDMLESEMRRYPARDKYDYSVSEKDADWPWWLPRHDAEEVQKAIAIRPDIFWKRLLPLLIENCARPKTPHYTDDYPFDEDPLWHDSSSMNHFRHNVPIVQIIATAGSLAVLSKTLDVRAITETSKGCEQRIVQQLVLTTLIGLSDDYADTIIRWLIQDTRRLALGEIGNGTHWKCSTEAIKKFAPSCDQPVYEALETTFLALRPRWEILDAKERLQRCINGQWKWQYYRNDIGLLQYACLYQLPPHRISSLAIERMRQLQTKFVELPDELDRHERGGGGRVRSPISHEGKELSDKAWLKLISSPVKQRVRNRQYGPDFVAVSSVETFSGTFQVHAEKDPVRFGNLALQFPQSADDRFWRAALQAVSRSKPDQNFGPGWKAAGPELCHALLRRLGYQINREMAIATTWFIQHRNDIDWESWVDDLVCRYAGDHSDPKADANADHSHDHRHDFLVINCVRGVAGLIISARLFKQPDLFHRFKVTILRLCNDPVMAVRAAGIQTLLPLLNANEHRQWAIDQFVAVCAESDDELLSSRHAYDFIYYTLGQVGNRYDAVFERMLSSQSSSVLEDGVQWTTIVWLYWGRLEDQYRRCCKGSSLERKTVAEVLSRQLVYEEVTVKCQNELQAFMDDPEKDVRSASGQFNFSQKFDIARYKKFLVQYVASRAYFAHHYHFVNNLKDHESSLVEFSELIFAMCDREANLTDEVIADEEIRFSAGETMPLLLRLYNEAENSLQGKAIRKGCLDRWDTQLRKRPNYFPAVLAAIDS